jgi:hypothetical protein
VTRVIYIKNVFLQKKKKKGKFKRHGLTVHVWTCQKKKKTKAQKKMKTKMKIVQSAHCEVCKINCEENNFYKDLIRE